MITWKRNLYICWIGSFFTVAGMNLVIPFLPLFIKQLGLHGYEEIEIWSSLAFCSTFITAAIFSPIWGKLADKHGVKPMLIRASLGMAVVVTLMGFVQNVFQLVALRFLMGIVSGFLAAAIILVATQTPSNMSGRALGILSTGGVAGTLIGPVFGGLLADFIGFRQVFWVTGIFLVLTFIIVLFIKEEKKDLAKTKEKAKAADLEKNPFFWKIALRIFVLTFVLQAALMSIQPILTLYVSDIAGKTSFIAFLAGIVTAVSGISNMIAAPYLGKLSDQLGPQKVLQFSLIAVAIMLAMHAFVGSVWQLIVLRFLLGFGLGGLIPAINTYLKKIVPQSLTGKIFGYNQTAQYIGNVAGPLAGGLIASKLGIPYVFIISCCLLLFNALWLLLFRRRMNKQQHTTHLEG
ncbi:MFS transporter [Bacillus massiliigorillae]|uniref:MFS transporter n=1 Tax=Bacillus massiliigorillae TaxID=1243664 RepID=UPI00039DB39E|nr:MFS transporter [Bacillus massiliigorillae]